MRKSYPLMADINVTNLVDVVLVLLIIFMIAAPMLQSGIEVNLPKSSATTKELGEGILVSVSKEGKIFIDDKPIILDRFASRLAQVKRAKNATSVYLRADKEVSYGLVIQIVGKIKALGIENLGLVTE
ncbi:MAG: hypothetical protein A2145_06175 [candidate division Zixibacteria bacterium RBG_16_40_9]|nr:MAG: hypothetical protein A2145_06175 [candidate division Zixibacteria bacterium RBG_16_40_9]